MAGKGSSKRSSGGGSRSTGSSGRSEHPGKRNSRTGGPTRGHTGDDRASGSGKRGRGQGRGGAYRKNSRTDSDIICGHHAVAEAIESGVPIEHLLIAAGQDRWQAESEGIAAIAARAGITVESAPKSKLDQVSEGLVHQGVVALTTPYNYTPLGDVMHACEGREAALVVLLDHITDVGNFGAIVRTCEVVGASAVVIPDRRSVAVVASVYKTSAGAVSRIPICRVSNIGSACDKLRDNGFWVAGASEKASQTCWESPMSGRLGLVMGSEGDGISRLVQSRCDFLVALPQLGEIGSLNVSCATAALGYEWMRQCYSAGMLDAAYDGGES